MTKKLFLHIGSGKTGTTSIQFMLSQNKEKLLENGYLYSTKGYLAEPNHHDLVSTPFDDKMWDKDKEKYKDLLYIFEKSSASTMIISTEKLLGAPAYYINNLKTMFDSFDVKVVVYVRNQVDLLPSIYLQRQQDLTADYKKNFSGFFDFYKDVWGNDSKIIIENWLTSFGRENILVRVYDKETLQGGDACADFAKVLGISTYITNTKFNKNVSLLPELSKLISIIDNNIPRLTIINSVYFQKVRQQTLMKSFLKISSQYKNDELDKAINELNTIANIIHVQFPRIDTHKLFQIFIEIYKVQEIFVKRKKISLSNLELRQMILDYYKESNYLLSNIFLSEKESRVFLKYYIQTES